MDGSWRVFTPSQRWRGGPGHTIRVVICTEAAVAVGYRVHDLAIVATREEYTLVGHLGPDLLGPDWDPQEAVRRLRLRPERPIGEALLDQRNLAGIGTLYLAETLFECGADAWAATSSVDDLHRVVTTAYTLITGTRARRHPFVYGRAGLPCRRCGTVVRRAPLGERTAYWCSTCQPSTAFT
jgi:endonuclease-8